MALILVLVALFVWRFRRGFGWIAQGFAVVGLTIALCLAALSLLAGVPVPTSFLVLVVGGLWLVFHALSRMRARAAG